MDIGVPCGYVQLKLGLQESTRILINVLEANEARGCRKFIRAECNDDVNAAVNYTAEAGVFRGKVLDISAAGIAAKFDTIAKIPPNSMLRGVQLRLRGGIVMADMIYLGPRPNDKLVQILLFDPKLSNENKLTIHRYIKMCLQKYINGLKL
jgi:hypothetical protein